MTDEQVVERTMAWAGRLTPRLFELIARTQDRIEALVGSEDPDIDALEAEFERLAGLQVRTVQLLQGRRTVDRIREAEAESMKEVLDRLEETRRMIAEAEGE